MERVKYLGPSLPQYAVIRGASIFATESTEFEDLGDWQDFLLNLATHGYHGGLTNGNELICSSAGQVEKIKQVLTARGWKFEKGATSN